MFLVLVFTGTVMKQREEDIPIRGCTRGCVLYQLSQPVKLCFYCKLMGFRCFLFLTHFYSTICTKKVPGMFLLSSAHTKRDIFSTSLLIFFCCIVMFQILGDILRNVPTLFNDLQTFHCFRHEAVLLYQREDGGANTPWNSWSFPRWLMLV